MKISVQDESPCKKVLSIEFPSDQLKAAHKGILREFIEHSRLPGFRKGKTPDKIVESKFAQEIRSEVLKRLLPKICSDAFEREKIRAVSDPVVSKVLYDLEKGLSFQAVVEVYPAIELPAYHGLKLSRDSIDVGEDEINRMIEELRERHAVFEPVSGRALQYGDYAIVDYSSWDSKSKKKDERKNALIYVKGDASESINSQLVGMEVGEVRTAAIEGSNETPSVNYQVQLNEIKIKKLPELDEEFFRELGPFKDLGEMRERVKSDILIYKEKMAREGLRNSAVRRLADEAAFDVPESQVRQEIANILGELERRMKKGAAKPVNLEDPGLREEARKEALRRIKAAYILHEIAVKEAIAISEEELSGEIHRLSEHVGKPPEQLKAELEKLGRLETIRARLLQDKVIDFVIEKAIIQ